MVRPREARSFIDRTAHSHVIMAADDWCLRESCIGDPGVSLRDLAVSDRRVIASVDAVRVLIAGRWQGLTGCIEEFERGTDFILLIAASVARSRSLVHDLWRRLTERDSESTIDCVAWIPSDGASAIELIADRDSSETAIVAALALARARGALDDAMMCDWFGRTPNDRLRRLIVKMAGEGGLGVSVSRLRRQLRSSDPECIVASALTGQLESHQDLYRVRCDSGVDRDLAATVGRIWSAAFSGTVPEDGRASQRSVVSLRSRGWRVDIESLIERLGDHRVGRAAGEALSMITGVDLAYEDMETDPPTDFESGPERRSGRRERRDGPRRRPPLARCEESRKVVEREPPPLPARGPVSLRAADQRGDMLVGSGARLPAPARRRRHRARPPQARSPPLQRQSPRLAPTRPHPPPQNGLTFASSLWTRLNRVRVAFATPTSPRPLRLNDSPRSVILSL